MRLIRGIKKSFQRDTLVAILDRISNPLFYHFEETRVVAEDVVDQAKQSTIHSQDKRNLNIVHAYLSDEWGKTLFGKPKKLNQYADHDHFLALALLGRVCRGTNERQAIIHFTRALLLTLNETRCAGLTNKQIMSFKQEGIDFLAKWANKPVPYKNKREQEYALLAKWALSVLGDSSIQNLMRENANINSSQILTFASNDKFYNQCTLEERVIIRQHLETGLNNAFGHGKLPLSNEVEQRWLKYPCVVNHVQPVHHVKENSFVNTQKIIEEKLQIRAPLPAIQNVHSDGKRKSLTIRRHVKMEEKISLIPKSLTLFKPSIELDDQPGARLEDKGIQKRESISLQPGLFKSESDLARQVKLLPEIRVSKNTVKEASHVKRVASAIAV